MTKVKTENQKTVTLTTGIKRGENTITDIVINKPNVFALKGLKLVDVLNVDVDAITKLLPRVTSPALTEMEIKSLDIVDFTELATSVITFFIKPDQLETA